MSKQKMIEQQLEQALMEGRWKLFERLPAERQLADELHVNRTTLRAAISALAETTHGSGTRVRALPSEHPAQCPLIDRIDASLLIIPSIIRASSLVIRPSQVLRLERILPVAGTALRNDDIKAFAQANIQFFMETARFINNASVSSALAACLPDGKSLIRLFNACDLQQKEQAFAHLARILSAVRHADAADAEAAAQAYFSTLRTLTENS